MPHRVPAQTGQDSAAKPVKPSQKGQYHKGAQKDARFASKRATAGNAVGLGQEKRREGNPFLKKKQNKMK